MNSQQEDSASYTNWRVKSQRRKEAVITTCTCPSSSGCLCLHTLVSFHVCRLSSARLANDSALNGIALCGKHAYIYLCWQRNNTDAIATVAGDTIQHEPRSLASSKTPCEPACSWSRHMVTVVKTHPASPLCVCVRFQLPVSLYLPPLLSPRS